MDDRLVGDKLSNGDRFSDAGELGSRPCQNILGEAVVLNGEEDGEGSCLLKLFYQLLSHSFIADTVSTYSGEARRVPS